MVSAVQKWKANDYVKELEDALALECDVQTAKELGVMTEYNAVQKGIAKAKKYARKISDAYDVMKKYANVTGLENVKKETGEGNMVNMAKGLQDWAAEERNAGMNEKTRGIVENMLHHGMSDEDIMMLTECTKELLEEVKGCITAES